MSNTCSASVIFALAEQVLYIPQQDFRRRVCRGSARRTVLMAEGGDDHSIAACHDLSSSRVLHRARLEDKSWHGREGMMKLQDIPHTPDGWPGLERFAKPR